MTHTDESTSTIRVGHVTSADGTRIGYRQLGEGPGVVLLHGSMQSSLSHLQLATALAGAFTVYLPDRRGRGLSGEYAPAYTMRSEVADLAALLERTGAASVFGVSASGLVVLEAARTLPGIRKVAAYEPALLPAGTTHTAWLERYDREMAAGRTGHALVTSMIGLELAPPAVARLPRWFLAGFTNMAMRSEDKRVRPEDITMRRLAPTLHHEGQLIAEMAGTLETFSTVEADVLLMGGAKGLPFLRPALRALERTLPSARRVEFAGLDHGSAADATKANPGGRPAIVAAELRRFLEDASAPGPR